MTPALETHPSLYSMFSWAMLNSPNSVHVYKKVSEYDQVIPQSHTEDHQISNSYLKEYRRYAPDAMQFLETRSEVKF